MTSEREPGVIAADRMVFVGSALADAQSQLILALSSHARNFPRGTLSHLGDVKRYIAKAQEWTIAAELELRERLEKSDAK